MEPLKRIFSHYRKVIFMGCFLMFFGIIVCCLITHPFKKDSTGNSPEQIRTSTLSPRLRFEKNVGQTDPAVDFLCRGRDNILYITAAGPVVNLSGNKNYESLCVNFKNSNHNSIAKGIDQERSTSNYFIGNDPGKWLTNIPHYARVGYYDIYKGIDMVYYVRDNDIEFDFIIKSGAVPDEIHLNFSKNANLKLNEGGDLVVRNGTHGMVYRKPKAWQTIHNKKHNVEVRYAFANDHEICFNVGKYDKKETLVIDPQFVYSTYLGGNSYDIGLDIAVDDEGCAYVTGTTNSADFPTYNAYQNDLTTGKFDYLEDVFVTKFNPEGNDIIFSTYIGGNWDDVANGIAVDANKYVYITGTTSSLDDPETPEHEGFPVMNAYMSESGDSWYSTPSDAFLTILNNTGTSLYYSTYFGGDGEDTGEDIAISSDGYAFITGNNFSFDLPLKNAYLESKPSYYYDAYVAKFNPHTSGENSLVYSSYLGGDLDDYAYGIAVDQYGCAYVTGSTKSLNFPTTADVIQDSKKKESDVFVTKFAADGSSLIYSTYLGSDGFDEGKDIEVDTSGCAYVCGYGRDGFPTTPGAFMTSGGYYFVSKLLPDGSDFAYSTFFTATGGIAIDDTGQVYVVSNYNTLVGGKIQIDAYVTALNPEGSDTVLALVFGGSEVEKAYNVAIDADRNMYVTGYTSSPDFPTENAYQFSAGGNGDVFVTKIGKPLKKDELIVEVLQDPLNYDAAPIPNTSFDIYSIDLNSPDDPYNFIESQSTDKNGLLHLPRDYYYPGMPIFIRYNAETKNAVKSNHNGESTIMYKVNVDNLIINNDGTLKAQLLETDPKDTTRTYLGHTSLGYNLVVSIEWLASADYVTNLVNAFMYVSNIMYDVTNGQAYINHITIFDDKEYWNDADIKIHTNNLQWPESHVGAIDSASDKGHVYLPPVFYSDVVNWGIQLLYDADPINPTAQINITSIIHELGHYIFGLYDEYQNAAGTYIFNNTNFGFMDNPDDFDDPMSTEMSDYVTGDSKFSDYSQTEQYYLLHKNCWDKFKNDHSKFYGPVRANIHSPKDLGISSNDVMAGPNNDVENPDFSVGDMMGYDLNVTLTTIPRRDYLVTAPNSSDPVAGAKVRLVKKNTGRWLYHGVTTNAGHIKLFNVEIGDKIYVASNNSDNYGFREVVVNNPPARTAITNDVIELRKVNGNFSILSEITFDPSGKPVFQCLSDPLFTASPSITVHENDMASDEQVLTAQGGIYSSALNNPDFSNGFIFFTAPDNLEENFFITHNAIVLDVSEMTAAYYNSTMQLELTIDQNTTTAEKLSLLSSGFPTPETGLPDSVIRVSDVIGLNTYPDNSDISAKFQIYYYADSIEALVPEAMTLYKWDNGWSALETGVDLEHNTVAAEIDGPGYYAAFMDLTKSGVITGIRDNSGITGAVGIRLYPNAPNPFGQSTVIRFDLPFRSKVNVDIYDTEGRKVRTLINRILPAGNHSMEWNSTNNSGKKVTPGVYICVLQTGYMMLSHKMLIINDE